MSLTVGELKEFIKDLLDSAPVLIESVQRGETSYGVDTDCIYFSTNVDGNGLFLTPSEIEISDDEPEW